MSRDTTLLEMSGGKHRDTVCCVRGNIDRIDGDLVVGWAFDSDHPDTPVHLEIRGLGEVLGTGIADEYRHSLKDAGFADGTHGFSIELNVPFAFGQTLELILVDARTNTPIAANPYTVTCRHPVFVEMSEMDAKGVRGIEPKRNSNGRRKRQLGKLTASVLRPIRKLKGRKVRRPLEKPVPDVLTPGVLAKLSSIDNAPVSSVAHLDSWPVLKLPAAATPLVSIIIPVHNQFHLTYQCLASIIMGAGDVSFEVLLVDDTSTDATIGIESRVNNLRVIRNTSNLGFLHNCNKAAATARGDFLLFLNNDTEVEFRWIDEMYDVFQRFSQVGAVGAKLVYPDGRLQDAGGIVWESGTPWNVGHGRDPDDPEFNYVREVDYLTGAALMVSKEAWQAVDGFTEAYAPAYYEDTDLAFKLRAAGFKTFYCPQSTVVHYEGRSNGTSLDSGIKQHQRINAELFKTTWQKTFVGKGEEGVNLARHKDRNRGLRVLMIDNAFPRLGQDAGSYAALQEMKLLLALGCKVTFLPHNLLHLGVHVDALQRMGVECVYAPYYHTADSFLESRAAEFDVVYVTRYTVASRIIEIVRQYSQAKIIFNNADLHFLRELRTALANGDTDLSGPKRTRARELAVMTSVDAVLSYNELEHEIIASHLLRDDHIFKCPWVLEPKQPTGLLSGRKGLAFLGGFGHPPNRQAMDWFVEHVLPLLHTERPELKLHIWGSQVPADVSWHDDERIIVEGYADSLDQVFNSCYAFVAPLQSGAGIKGKVLDSMSYGVPTVLSPIAAEATGLVDGVSTLIAESPEMWASQILRLIDDESLWQRLSDASCMLRDTQYSFEKGVTQMRKVFDALSLTTGIPEKKVQEQ